jgi:hypothetical protein
MSKGCDDKCHELASYFLPNGEALYVSDLAQDIQDTIENWLSAYEQSQLPHTHTCQQCDKVVIAACECKMPVKNIWCSSNCRDAFDL